MKIFFLQLLTLFFLFGCSKIRDNNSGLTIHGKVTLEGESNHSGVTVSLYYPVQLDTMLVNICEKHPNIGISVSQRTQFDHRLAEEVYSAVTNSDGTFEFKGAEEAYILVARKAGYGWKYLFDLTNSQLSSDSKPPFPLAHFAQLPTFYAQCLSTLGVGLWTLGPPLFSVTSPSSNYAVTLLKERHLSGLLTGHIIWESGRHYVIEDGVTIPAGSSLTIEAGSWIRSKAESQLLFEGEVRTLERNEEMAVFTSDQPVPHRGDWKGIRFGPSGSSSFSLTWVKVEWAENGVFLASEGDLKNVLICNCSQNGVTSFNHIGSISNTIANRNRIGIYTESSLKSEIIDHNVVLGNEFIGVDCRTSSPLINNNYVTGSEEGIRCILSSPEISNNEIIMNEYGIDISSGSPKINLNMIGSTKETAIMLGFLAGGNPGSKPIIKMNNFTENNKWLIVFVNDNRGVSIEAMENWWGTNDITWIRKNIKDGNITTGYGKALIQPIQMEYITEAGIN